MELFGTKGWKRAKSVGVCGLPRQTNLTWRGNAARTRSLWFFLCRSDRERTITTAQSIALPLE